MANEICLSRQRLADVSGPLFKSHWQRFQAWHWLSRVPEDWGGSNSPQVLHPVFSIWAHRHSHTQHWALELQAELRTCKFSQSQYLPQGKQTGQPARCFENKLVTNWKVLIHWSSNVQACLAFPIHSTKLSQHTKRCRLDFVSSYTNSINTCAKHNYPSKKLLFTTIRNFFFLNNWTVNQ